MRSSSEVGAARAPEVTPAGAAVLEAQRMYRSERERRQRRSVVRGVVALAVLALLWSVARAGLGRVFVHGWWRQW